MVHLRDFRVTCLDFTNYVDHEVLANTDLASFHQGVDRVILLD